MDSLIKQLAARVIEGLNELEREADFERFLNLPDSSIGEEAMLLRDNINGLKKRLEEIN